MKIFGRLLKNKGEGMEIKNEFAERLVNCKWLQNCSKQEEFGFEVEYVKSKKQ